MNELEEVKTCEAQLRLAMLSSDVEGLSALIDEGLVFTGPDGSVLGKAQDLSAHQSGQLKLERLDVLSCDLHPVENMVFTTTKAKLVGRFGDMRIDGIHAYTRLWSRASGQWQVVAGQVGRIA